MYLYVKAGTIPSDFYSKAYNKPLQLTEFSLKRQFCKKKLQSKAQIIFKTIIAP